ncbi:MAG: hypothetical protein Ta2A_14590 [Treponemataceae bacterium]|nr:MAG: hypothetical protein Ta2A_14590 [Treponemataceae bacterium]
MKLTLNKKGMLSVSSSVVAGCVFLLASCGKLDVVGADSARAFGEMLNALPQPVAEDHMNGGWSLSAPDGGARFVWSENYAKSMMHDVMLEFDAEPFLAAGLDPEKLPMEIAFFDGKLMVGTKLGNETLTYSGEATPLASFEQIVNKKRKTIGYHGALDHYGVDLGGGNLFEFAKDMGANDKDIVFVLNPEPFIAAGVDTNNIAGWVFAPVTVDDENGKPVVVDKILKPFDLN